MTQTPTPTPLAKQAAPKGTTPNKSLIAYPPGSVTAPASPSAAGNGYQNTTQDISAYQVPV